MVFELFHAHREIGRQTDRETDIAILMCIFIIFVVNTLKIKLYMP